MPRRRFFVPQEQVRNGIAVLTPDQAHHLRTVLRLRAGEEVELFDGAGLSYAGTIQCRGAEIRIGPLREIDPSERPGNRACSCRRADQIRSIRVDPAEGDRARSRAISPPGNKQFHRAHPAGETGGEAGPLAAHRAGSLQAEQASYHPESPLSSAVRRAADCAGIFSPCPIHASRKGAGAPQCGSAGREVPCYCVSVPRADGILPKRMQRHAPDFGL